MCWLPGNWALGARHCGAGSRRPVDTDRGPIVPDSLEPRPVHRHLLPDARTFFIVQEVCVNHDVLVARMTSAFEGELGYAIVYALRAAAKDISARLGYSKPWPDLDIKGKDSVGVVRRKKRAGPDC